jgi:hypothetical protein
VVDPDRRTAGNHARGPTGDHLGGGRGPTVRRRPPDSAS